MVAPGLMINLAPGAIVTSPVRVCTPAQVSVPVIVPVVVSFEADTVPAGKANESNMLNKNNPVNENDRNFSSRAIMHRTTSRQFNHRAKEFHRLSVKHMFYWFIPNSISTCLDHSWASRSPYPFFGS